MHRLRRRESRIPLVALVGYTNAGKSTLLNKLTGAEVLAEDKLFATLDPTTRHLVLPEQQEILLTDTVGFVRKLPHTLVSAFRATLEEVQEADLLLHVVDCSCEQYEQQIAAVIEVLQELRADQKPTFYVFNKADCMENESVRARMLQGREGICVSARTGENLAELQRRIEQFFRESRVTMKLLIPFSDGGAITRLHQLHAVRSTEYAAEGTRLTVSLPASEREPFEKYSEE